LRRCPVVSPLLAEMGAMGRGIESRLGIEGGNLHLTK
jgi:hypothetical protein